MVYPFSDLEEGPHTLELKAWDVHNNSAKATLDFVVVSRFEVFLDGLVNYPNPMDGGARPSDLTTTRHAWPWRCRSMYTIPWEMSFGGEREETPRDTEDGWHWDGPPRGEPLRGRLPLPFEPHELPKADRPTGPVVSASCSIDPIESPSFA